MKYHHISVYHCTTTLKEQHIISNWWSILSFSLYGTWYYLDEVNWTIKRIFIYVGHTCENTKYQKFLKRLYISNLIIKSFQVSYNIISMDVDTTICLHTFTHPEMFFNSQLNIADLSLKQLTGGLDSLHPHAHLLI